METNPAIQTPEPSDLDWCIYTGTGYAYFIGAEKAPLRQAIKNEERLRILELVKDYPVDPAAFRWKQQLIEMLENA